MKSMQTHNAQFVKSLTANKHDPELGRTICQYLKEQGLETPFEAEMYSPQAAFEQLQDGIFAGLEALGLDMTNPSLKDTPARYACMVVGELTEGLCYDLFPKCTAVPAETQDMVLVRGCQVMSLCEHHLQTIDGVAHIAYIPNKKWLGLSKFARVVEFFSRRPQVQERLTAQVYAALSHILETEDIAVVIRATHYCMKARGTMQQGSDTTTDKMGGRFFTNSSLRQEFMDAIR